jgi:hypothetical protein
VILENSFLDKHESIVCRFHCSLCCHEIVTRYTISLENLNENLKTFFIINFTILEVN